MAFMLALLAAVTIATCSLCGRGDRGGVSWFDVPRATNRSARRRA